MFKNILVLCLGNICRSPIAEGLLKEKIKQANLIIKVHSAGLTAMVGDEAHLFSKKVVLDYGFTLDSHIARQVTQEMIREADLILVMDDEQRRLLESEFHGASGKTFRLGHFSNFDIPDPYGKGEDAFIETYALIDKGIADWIENIR